MIRRTLGPRIVPGLCLLVPVLCLPPIFAQTKVVQGQSPTSTVQSQSGAVQSQSGGAQSQPAQSTLTLRATTQLVVVDVVVLDGNRRPVHGLKAADFSLEESKQLQIVKNFEEHNGVAEAAKASSAEPMPKLEPGLFTNFEPVPEAAALNVILFDALNTPLKDQEYVRSQVLKFLKSDGGKTRIALFTLNNRLSLLQGFTADPEALKAAISGKNASGVSSLLDDGVDITPALGIGIKTASSAIQDFGAQTQSLQVQLRTQYTLDAMGQIAQYLLDLPGRKNLLWFSGSFPISILPDPTLSNPFSTLSDSSDQFRETTSLLSRGRVAVFPIDGRGIRTQSTFDVTKGGGAGFGRSGRSFGQDLKTFSDDSATEHQTMEQIARDTGGEAFYNTNGLSEAVTKALDFGDNFYTLSYTPTDARKNGDFRNISVQLTKAGYSLAYRRGYYAADAKAKSIAAVPASQAAASDAANPSSPGGAEQSLASVRRVRAAMERGAPGVRQIIFKARVQPATALAGTAITAADNTPDPKAKGPWRSYQIDVAADPHAVKFIATGPDLYRGDVELIALVYDQNGALLNAVTHGVTTNLSRATYVEMLRSGYPLQVTLSVPVKGDSFIRLGVHDLASDRLGSLELPVAAIRNLPIITASRAVTPTPEKASDTPGASPAANTNVPVSHAGNGAEAPANGALGSRP